MKHSSLLALLGCAAFALLAGCGGSSSVSIAGQGPASGSTIPAKAYDVTINSPVTNNATGGPTTPIVATVYVPEHVQGAAYPLIVHSHGWGGNRVTQSEEQQNNFDTSKFYSVAIDAQVGPFWREGYAVISFDERGFHDSGGAIRVMDPAYETRDAIAVLDWAQAHLNIQRDAQGRLDIGTMGGSYGGGFQLLLAALDDRVKAIAPSVTWHNLVTPSPAENALAPNGVIKKLWDFGLCEAAQQGQLQGQRTMSTDLTNVCLQAGDDPTIRFVSQISPNLVGFLYHHGLGYFETLDQDPSNSFKMRKVDALFTQGMVDNLFPLNEAWHNFQFLSSKGGDVRLITNQHGHYIGPPLANQAPLGAMACGKLSTIRALHLWFAQELKNQPGAADAIPKVCISLDDTHGATFDKVPVADGQWQVTVPTGATIVAVQNNYGGTAPTFIPLSKPIDRDGLVLAGIPIADLTVAPLVSGSDAVAFVGVGVQSPGASPQLIDNQVMPLRVGDNKNAELAGVGAVLHKGDVVGVLLYGDFDNFNNPAKTAWITNNYTVSGTVNLPIETPLATE